MENIQIANCSAKPSHMSTDFKLMCRMCMLHVCNKHYIKFKVTILLIWKKNVFLVGNIFKNSTWNIIYPRFLKPILQKSVVI